MRKIFEILEFDKIKELILKYNINELSRNKLQELKPNFFIEVIQEEINKTKEGYILVNKGTFPSLYPLTDYSLSLETIHKNGVVSIEKIYDFAISLQVIDSLRKFLQETKFDEEMYFTNYYINSLQPIYELAEQIKYCITVNMKIADNASAKLKTIRNSIKKIESEIKSRLNDFLKNNASSLTDNFIATRGNHFVLPIKASCKNQVKGIVIDVSATQNTYFIEPYFVTESNIMLEQLRYDEEIEIQRIIKALCELVNKHYEELITNLESLKEISFMVLKGVYGLNNNYEVATLNEDNSIELIDAYHPLIDIKSVVKNDFKLGGDNNNIIVISGPNAGGKTVALKTLALIVLMNQCGLPLPIKQANIGIFRKFFVDIGDNQSIEESLSGFSSHMKNVINILNNVDEHSLVIMDELASKTDPSEGEALAKAIIEYIENSNAIAMITTHYVAIKDYAKENSNITLASMGFDETTLYPTYKLLVNMIGRSYAFEISYRLGLKKEIIDKAKSYKTNSSNKLDALIDELSIKLKEENDKLVAIESEKKQLEAKLIEVENTKEQMDKDIQKSIEEAKQIKQEMIDEAQQQIEEIVSEFKKNSDLQGIKHHFKTNALNKLESLQDVEKESEQVDDSVKVGDNVIISSLNKLGEVIEIKGNKCKVSSASTILIIPLSDVKKTTKVKPNPKRVKVLAQKDITRSVPISLNLIGMHVEEALVALRNYIDAAMLARYPQVTIIHGFGTGALRKAVHNYLKTNKYVAEYELGGFMEGGAGSTLVKLKGKK